MRRVLATYKALADETRLRIVMALDGVDELCLCQLIDMLGLSPATVSKHVNMLFEAGLVHRRKEGRWHYFRLVRRAIDPMVRKALAGVMAGLAHDDTVVRDRDTLGKTLNTEATKLCRVYQKNSTCCSSAPATAAGAKWPKGGPACSKATRSKRTQPV